MISFQGNRFIFSWNSIFLSGYQQLKTKLPTLPHLILMCLTRHKKVTQASLINDAERRSIKPLFQNRHKKMTHSPGIFEYT
jgi:hypothetical protein